MAPYFWRCNSKSSVNFSCDIAPVTIAISPDPYYHYICGPIAKQNQNESIVYDETTGFWNFDNRTDGSGE